MLLKNHLIGKHFLKIEKCASTNSIAMEFLQESTQIEGWVFSTNEQTKGRGQRGNSWEAEPAQNLTFSCVIKPTFLLAYQQFGLNFFISLAIYDFLKEKIPSVSPKIKWPNDIYINELKIAGILVENIIKSKNIDVSVIGIGLNVNQVLFHTVNAQSIRKLTQEMYELDSLLPELTSFLNERYEQLMREGTKNLKKQYLENLYWIQEERTFFDVQKDEFFVGKIIGVDDFGQLIIQLANEQRAFAFKEVQFIQ